MAQLTVAIVAQGEMGAAIGRCIAGAGAKVVTSLAGRSEASRARAATAGLIHLDDPDLVAQADIFLSVLPPGEALGLAQRFRPALEEAPRRPVYVDCNAVSPITLLDIATCIDRTGAPFVDGGIIGGPPRPGYTPKLFVSGPHAQSVLALRDYGLDVQVIGREFGEASSLKMCYGAMTKGLVAMGSTIFLAAARSGSGEALRSELATSQPELTRWLDRQVPASYDKAYRWIAEMEEVAAFMEAAGVDSGMHQAAARLFRRIAAANKGMSKQEPDEIAALKSYLAQTAG
jgi:L-threonate 2-dehydrogenase